MSERKCHSGSIDFFIPWIFLYEILVHIYNDNLTYYNLTYVN